MSAPSVPWNLGPEQRANRVFSTFALAFWYSLKMYLEARFNSAETLIV